MTAYDNLWTLRYGTKTLRRRVEVAVAATAYGILSEDPATPNHDVRLVWAKGTLQNPGPVAESVMWGVIANATIQAQGDGATDAQVKTASDAAIAALLT